MGHSHHTYDEFDNDLTRPLYGHVSEFKDGTVPDWVKKPSVSQSHLELLFEIPFDKYDGDIPKRDLPNGVSKKRGRGPTRYVIDRDTYLEQHRKRVQNQDDDERRRFDIVRFELNMRGSGVVVSHATGSGPTVPDKIKDRLSEIRNTSRWNRKVDGHHINFSQWDLTYRLGPRGGINSVHIEADLNH